MPPLGLRDLFPGHIPPGESEVAEFIRSGLVALDTNALFDLYRFNRTAREEYLQALRLLGDRLWIPNRVAEEFLRGRLNVVQECSAATRSLAADLEDILANIEKKLHEFANRRGLLADQIDPLKRVAKAAIDEIESQVSQLFSFELDLDTAIRGDDILSEIETLIDGKIGPPIADQDAARSEALSRLDKEIPPGYKDGKKDSAHAIGDYFIWAQLLTETKDRSQYALLVSNDQKEDWIREEQGRKLGPRLELIEEMQRDASASFHMITVRSFLVQARKFLGATVSDETVAQAGQFDEIRKIEARIKASSFADPKVIEIKLRRSFYRAFRVAFERGHNPTVDYFMSRLESLGHSPKDIADLLFSLRDEGVISWDGPPDSIGPRTVIMVDVERESSRTDSVEPTRIKDIVIEDQATGDDFFVVEDETDL